MYEIILYVSFGILPSLIWLFYYLRKDAHPEPQRMIIKIFLYGMLVTVPVFFTQIGLAEFLRQFETTGIFAGLPILISIIKWFVIIALTEELFKYLVFKLSVQRSSALDEPLDVMLYMVIVALGFAALENILYLFSPINSAISFSEVVKTTAMISFIRFIGATFLHTLCSALLGYFLALSFCNTQKRIQYAATGMFLAVLLHGLYDFSIMELQHPFNVMVPMAVVLGLAVFMVYAFRQIKKLKDVCKIN